ncbi:MAG TPA: hypothetical protein PK802_00030 [Candidatus Cloacimonadota bacterium]|nr:hypothetical protein [Candidatus Cloacimonadota bacterium]HOF59503.1 hypothetical protein [Candidatus Cloacimonadota bacterium]HOR58784.1 hypothetical protein [Candidatus Cloacimonadota bacterium]HPB08063.1 hypothetical protein [Candidatus Cloacimonadota bacterium]HQL13462.1 hypothetical protein [Candidatus Cloacimonadota bacterium]
MIRIIVIPFLSTMNHTQPQPHDRCHDRLDIIYLHLIANPDTEISIKGDVIAPVGLVIKLDTFQCNAVVQSNSSYRAICNASVALSIISKGTSPNNASGFLAIIDKIID